MSVGSVQRWRQAWADGGPRALRSSGPASLPRLSDAQFAQLECELAKGPGLRPWKWCSGLDLIRGFALAFGLVPA